MRKNEDEKVGETVDGAKQGDKVDNAIIDENNSVPPNQNNEIDSDIKTDKINTSDWLTYQNEEFGINLKYPRGWNIDVYDNKITIKNTTKEVVLGGITPDDLTTNPSKYENTFSLIEIYAYENTSKLDWKSFFDIKLHNTVADFELYEVNNQLDGVVVTKLEGIMYGDPSLFFKQDKNIYSIHFINSSPDEEKLNKNVFNQILSTIKLID